MQARRQLVPPCARLVCSVSRAHVWNATPPYIIGVSRRYKLCNSVCELLVLVVLVAFEKCLGTLVGYSIKLKKILLGNLPGWRLDKWKPRWKVTLQRFSKWGNLCNFMLSFMSYLISSLAIIRNWSATTLLRLTKKYLPLR